MKRPAAVRLAALALITVATALAGPASAQHDHGSAPAAPVDHAKMMGEMKGEMKGGGSSSLPSVEGEVRRVDKAAGKVTLRHGEIKQFDMPPMTMVFEVSDKAMLDNLKAGDKVHFRVVNEGGKMVVTELKPAR